MKISKRHVALLEVLIAFALIVMCLIPIIYPQVAIIKAERAFVDTIEVDHCVHLLYTKTLEKLYLHKISWDTIESGEEVEITESQMGEAGCYATLPYTGTMKFVLEKKKPPKPKDKIVSLYKINYSFKPKNKGLQPLEYTYLVMIEKKVS